MNHEPRLCVRNMLMTFGINKGAKSLFECPACGRKTYQALNFLGRRNVVCDGVRFTKQPRLILP